MEPVSLNYLAIIVSAVAAMVIGAAWYSPLLFAKAWMKEVGKKEEELGQANSGYVIAIISNLVMAYVLAHFVDYAGAVSVATGAAVGFWAWLGFVLAGTLMNYIFEGRSLKLYWINTLMQLVVLVVAGIILAVWR